MSLRQGTARPYERLRRFVLLALAGVAAVFGAAAVTAPAALAWQPGPAKYGVGERANVPVRMRDGTVLRANVYYPTATGTGKEAKGTFPSFLLSTRSRAATGCASRSRRRTSPTPCPRSRRHRG